MNIIKFITGLVMLIVFLTILFMFVYIAMLAGFAGVG